MWAPTADGLLLGVVEAAPQRVLEGRQPTLVELGRRHVDLDVELPELGLEVGVRDRLERLGVLQRRVADLVDQVELDLQPGHRVVGVEARLTQHPGEDVQIAAHLLAVPGPVGTRELLSFHLFAHGVTLGTSGPGDSRVRGIPGALGADDQVVDDPGDVAGAFVGGPLPRSAAPVQGSGEATLDPLGVARLRQRRADVGHQGIEDLARRHAGRG